MDSSCIKFCYILNNYAMPLIILPGSDGSPKAWADFCKEKNIPYIVILNRNYKTTSKVQDYSFKNYVHKVQETPRVSELIHYCDIWSDFTIDYSNGDLRLSSYLEEDPINNPDTIELAELLTTDEYICVLGKTPKFYPTVYEDTIKLLNDTYTIIERNGNLQDLWNVKTKYNPIYKYMRNMYEMDWPAPIPYKESFRANKRTSNEKEP